MTHAEMFALIQGGIDQQGGVWADFGAGRGNFTRALRQIVGEQATLYAVDRDANALRYNTAANHHINADFTQSIHLPPLDGLLMANALHWIRRQRPTLERLRGYLKPGGRLLIVEYDVTRPRPYIPFPVGADRFKHLALQAGFTSVTQVGGRHSPSSGISMAALVATLIN